MFSGTIDPTRGPRTEALLRALRARSQSSARVLELGAGPGPLAVRILDRFPGCRVVALDSDPVLLRVGQEALRKFGRRITYVLADLRESGRSFGFPARRFDATVSSLTLHWLEESEIRALYRNVRRLLRPGGVLLNADFLPSSRPRSRRVRSGSSSDRPHDATRRAAELRKFKSSWSDWWNVLEKDPGMQAAFRERARRLPGSIPPRRTSGPKVAVSIERHEEALRDVGFREVQVVWHVRDFRVVMAVR